jgi:1,4-alpha-glucan branching enzyme
MALVSPKDGALIGGITQLVFDQRITDIDLKVNGINFHTFKDDKVCSLDLNALLPDEPIRIDITYEREDNTESREEVIVYKPSHDLAGMGATVIRNDQGEIMGTFFKFWLPQAVSVYVRGVFNEWRDANRLNQLGETGYWYGFSQEARPGDDYMLFVYGTDGKFNEVSDPAARDTIKTRYNDADANDANAVVIDWKAFTWLHDNAFLEQRRDFSRFNIYQLHWGTFLRPGSGGDLPFETFVKGTTEEEMRHSVRNKLQYIKDLGFTVIQLLPVHEANGNYNAGYDPSFFFAIESSCGQPRDLRVLVDEAHGLGLAVFFDVVINHLTKDETHSSFSQEFIKGWYTRQNAPWSNHNQWGGEDWGPDPDFDRMEVRNLLTDVSKMYFDEFHIDGIRLDATTTIPVHALQPMIGKLQHDYASHGKYLVAEHLTSDPFPYIIGEIGFNAAWYKPAWERCTYEALGPAGQGNLQKLQELFEANHNGLPGTAIKYLHGAHDQCWGNHDGLAAVTRLGGSANFYARSKMRLAWALNVCSLGIPMLFMGTEIMTDLDWHNYYGYNGHNAHNAEEGLNWYIDADHPAGRFKQMVGDINELRLEHGALRTPNSKCQRVHYDDQNGVIAFKRWDDYGCILLIVINISDHQWEQHQYEVYTGIPESKWREIFNSQDAIYGGWEGSGNAAVSFRPKADSLGKLQGINVPKWSLLILKNNT